VEFAPPSAQSISRSGIRLASNGQARESAVILKILRDHEVGTRPGIVRETGLSRAVVAQRLADLQSVGLVVDAGNEVSTGGRPPRQVQFNPSLGHVLVSDLGATSIDVAFADLSGRVLAHRSETSDIGLGPDHILGRVEALFEDLAITSSPPGRPWGIGLGVPGPVEFSTARPVTPPIMPGWDDYPVRERLSTRFDAPAWVDNDVNIMALGERAEGIARGEEDVVFIKVGTGIGAGIISHGRIQRGAQGSAGDVGHIQVVFDRDAIVCRCGKIGCLEAIAGGAALGRAAVQAAERGESALLADMLHQRGSLSASDIAEAARHGDRASVQLLRQAGRHIGQMLATVVNILNPSLIVIGGGVATAGDVLLASIREVVYGRSLPLATRHLQIQQSTLGDRAGVTGAAAMVLDQLFAPERVANWIDQGLSAGRPQFVAY
jgi:glucokinase-like ROK family protein